MTDIEDRVETLLKRVEVLEQQNAELRAERATAESAHDERRLNRRNLLRLGGAAAAIGAGSVLLRPNAAGALSGDTMVIGHANDAGSDPTSLVSTTSINTLSLTNSGGGNALHLHTSDSLNNHPALHVFDDGVGGAIFAEETNADPGIAAIFGTGSGGGVHGFSDGDTAAGVVGETGGLAAGVEGQVDVGSAGPAVKGTVGDAFTRTLHNQAIEASQNALGHGVYSHVDFAGSGGRAIYGVTVGTQNAILGQIKNTGSAASSILGSTTGKGTAVEGASAHGVGGKFAGVIQLYLVPGAGATHPTAAARGAFYVDSGGRLWFCKGGTTWKQLA